MAAHPVKLILLSLLLGMFIQNRVSAQEYSRDRPIHWPFVYGAFMKQFPYWGPDRASDLTPGQINMGQGGQVRESNRSLSFISGLSLYRGIGVSFSFNNWYRSSLLGGDYELSTTGIGFLYTYTFYRPKGVRRGVYLDFEAQYLTGNLRADGFIRANINTSYRVGWYTTLSEPIVFDGVWGSLEGGLLAAQIRFRGYLGSSLIMRLSFMQTNRIRTQSQYIDSSFPNHQGMTSSTYTFSALSFAIGLGISIFVPDRIPFRIEFPGEDA